MARIARAEVFDPAEVSVFHCINHCVRRCFLCGDDPLTGQKDDHRKQWLETRLRFLAGQFGIDVPGVCHPLEPFSPCAPPSAR
jgi:hypothetical protein